MPFVTKDLSTASMKRSKFRNNYLKNKCKQNTIQQVRKLLGIPFEKK